MARMQWLFLNVSRENDRESNRHIGAHCNAMRGVCTQCWPLNLNWFFVKISRIKSPKFEVGMRTFDW